MKQRIADLGPGFIKDLDDDLVGPVYETLQIFGVSFTVSLNMSFLVQGFDALCLKVGIVKNVISAISSVLL